MLVGLPGSGKSTYARDLAQRVGDRLVIISSDDIRQELWGDANDQHDPQVIFQTMFDRSVEALKNGYDVVYDATNLVAKTRKATVAAIKAKVDCKTSCLFVACSLSECKRRQGDRDRKVPDAVIDRMVRQFEAPWYNEGWDFIGCVHGGKRQNIDKEHWRMLGEAHDNPHHSASLGMHCVNCETNMREYVNSEEWRDVFTDDTKKMLIEAAYQHDLGKHKTKAFVDSKGNPSEVAHYYSHNNVGAYLWLSGDWGHKWTSDEFFFIALLIQWHMQPFFMRDDNGEWHINFQKWCDKRGFGQLFYDAVCLLHKADLAAH